MQAAGSSYVITDADVDEGEVDETVRNLSDGVTTEGYTDHFHGKGQKNFVDNYLELWEKVRTCLLNIAWPSKHFLWQQQTESSTLPMHEFAARSAPMADTVDSRSS